VANLDHNSVADTPAKQEKREAERIANETALAKEKAEAERKAKFAESILRNYQRLLRISFFAAIILIAIFAGIFFSTRNYVDAVGLLPIVALVGCTGAIFSALIRLYGYNDLPALLSLAELQALSGGSVAIYAIIPIVVGAIASAILYLVLASGMISGDIFPTFSCPETGCKGLGSLTETLTPKDGKDYAKAIVWGFIAGFAERLVPDTLGSFVKAANAAAEKSSSG